MPENSGLEPPAHSSPVASSSGKLGDPHKPDADADMNKLSASNTVVDSVCLEDAEKGSPPPPPHAVQDGGLIAWGTVIGA